MGLLPLGFPMDILGRRIRNKLMKNEQLLNIQTTSRYLTDVERIWSFFATKR